MPPLISVCIPLYNTEPYLLNCLRSVITQDFEDFEVLVFSDASQAKDEEGRSAKKIIALAQKECNAFRKSSDFSKLKIRFIQSNQNRGILEVRRSLCHEARGEYICFVDSDDQLEQGALKTLTQTLSQESYDIIQARSTSGTFDQNNNFTPAKINPYDKTLFGQFRGHQIFNELIEKERISGMLWAKLIKRKLLLQAFLNIPYCECNMAEDYLISFFLHLFASSYCAIDSKVYLYRTSQGVSSHRKIDTLHKWEMICSTASVFTVISQWLEQNKSKSQITPGEESCIRRKTSMYLANNLIQMKQTVIPELQAQARQLLCEYWGEHFVQTIEEKMSL